MKKNNIIIISIIGLVLLLGIITVVVYYLSNTVNVDEVLDTFIDKEGFSETAKIEIESKKQGAFFSFTEKTMMNLNEKFSEYQLEVQENGEKESTNFSHVKIEEQEYYMVQESNSTDSRDIPFGKWIQGFPENTGDTIPFLMNVPNVDKVLMMLMDKDLTPATEEGSMNSKTFQYNIGKDKDFVKNMFPGLFEEENDEINDIENITINIKSKQKQLVKVEIQISGINMGDDQLLDSKIQYEIEDLNQKTFEDQISQVKESAKTLEESKAETIKEYVDADNPSIKIRYNMSWSLEENWGGDGSEIVLSKNGTELSFIYNIQYESLDDDLMVTCYHDPNGLSNDIETYVQVDDYFGFYKPKLLDSYIVSNTIKATNKSELEKYDCSSSFGGIVRNWYFSDVFIRTDQAKGYLTIRLDGDPETAEFEEALNIVKDSEFKDLVSN